MKHLLLVCFIPNKMLTFPGSSFTVKQTNRSRVFDFDTERLLRLLVQVIDVDQDLY